MVRRLLLVARHRRSASSGTSTSRVGHWAGDGLLAIFFFVAGLELKREFLVGDLRSPAKAVVPVAAAIGGVIVPRWSSWAPSPCVGAEGDALRGWAIPTATDIAFALAVLAVIGSSLPSALRSFLLTLAVVDDLIAITIIAIFYTSDLDAGRCWRWCRWPVRGPGPAPDHPLVAAAAPGLRDVGPRARLGGARHRGRGAPRARRARQTARVGALDRTHDRTTGVAHRFEHRMRPISAGVAVPVFAFFAAGVRVVDGGLRVALTDAVALGVIAGLVLGKVGRCLRLDLPRRPLHRARLDDDLPGGTSAASPCSPGGLHRLPAHR